MAAKHDWKSSLEPLQGRVLYLCRRRWREAIALVLLVLLCSIGLNIGSIRKTSLTTTPFLPSTQTEIKAAHLHLLIPADHKDENLCKTILSAAVTGWPTPILINWGATFDNKELVAGGSHIAKISGVLDYLRGLGPEHNNDLVLLVDGYDIWLQLRPATLIARYHAINAAADARIEKEMGSKAFALEDIQQKIVFSAQKRCWPWKPEDPPCYAVPESSLPKDVYGPQTDTDIGFKKNPYVKFRQRYLNSGNVMGTVDALRSLFERAMEKADQDPNFGSDQKIFSEIFGDQEFQREVMRLRHRGSLQHWKDWLSGRKSIATTAAERHLREHKDGQPDEFGVGLDYASLLGHPTVFAEEDSAWITRSDGESITKAAEKLDTPLGRVSELPKDISETQPPFHASVQSPSSPLQFDQAWQDVPLYTNMWSGVSPGLIHHNAHRDGLKSLRRTVWDKMWYFKNARDLYSATSSGPMSPNAVIVDGDAEVAWWSPYANKGGAMADDGTWLEWKDLCTEFEGEVFRDN